MHGGSRRASWNQEANGPLLSLHAQSITRGSGVCYLNYYTLPPNDLCIPGLLSVSAAVSQRVGLEK